MALLEGGRGTELDTSRAEAQLHVDPGQYSAPGDGRQAGHVSIGRAHRPAAHRSGARAVGAPATPRAYRRSWRSAGLMTCCDDAPDIRVTERNLAAATANVGVATADLFPRVTFAGSVAFRPVPS